MSVEVRNISSVPEFRRMLRHTRTQALAIYRDFRHVQPRLRAAVEAAQPPKAITVRQRSGGGGSLNAPPPGARPSGLATQVNKVSRAVADFGDKLEVAQHIYELLQHHYDRSDPSIQKLLKMVLGLANELHTKFMEMLTALGQTAERYVPSDFRRTVEALGTQLEAKFQGRADSVTTSFSISAVPEPTTKMPILFHIGYVLFDNLDNGGTTHDYCVIVVRKQVPGKADQDFIRTVSEYKSPYWVATHDLGMAFDRPQEAYNLILTALHAEKMLDVVDPVALPVGQSDVRFDSDKIHKTLLDPKKGRVRLVLKPGLDEAGAKAVLTDSFAQLKRIVLRAHPRNKNTVSAKGPFQMPFEFKVKGGATRVADVWAIDFQFAAPDDLSKTVNLTRDRINALTRIFDLTPDQQSDFVRSFKRYFGAK